MTLWYPTMTTAGVFGGALLCLPVTRKMPWRCLVATTLYLALDVEILVLVPRAYGLRWNWLGNAASVLLALVAMRLLRLSRVQVGLTLPRRGCWPWIWGGLAIVLVWTLAGARGFFRERLDIETLLYQPTMPALGEELAYRGVAYALLLRGYGEKRLLSSSVAAILITSCCFGLGHIEPSQGALPPEFFWTFARFRALQFGSKFLFAALLAIVRWRSGSLLSPALAHGSANIAGTLAAGRL